jgi:hypothetical protein
MKIGKIAQATFQHQQVLEQTTPFAEERCAKTTKLLRDKRVFLGLLITKTY